MCYTASMGEAHDKIIGFYDKHIDEFGSGPRAVGWGDKHSQEARFGAMCRVGDLEGKSILDVGCGLGDFYAYLTGHYGHVDYTGIDINPRYIEKARQLRPAAHFAVADFGEYAGGPFDYVVASGIFSVKIPEYKNIYFGQIKKMFALARKGVAFTMLDAAHHPNDETYAAYSIEEVRGLCRSLTDDVVVYHDYLPHDFTMVLKRRG